MTVQNKPTIGWIGTGVMGLSMCRRLMNAGWPAVVHNRTREKAQPLIDAGATWAKSAGQVAADAEVIFTMVGFPDDVAEVYQGEAGILARARVGSLLIDMTTTSPMLAQEIGEAAKLRGLDFVDGPVSGGDVGARSGKLAIMAGGENTAMARALPFFNHLGSNIVHQGPAGSGQHTKMCNQITIAGTMIGVSECLVYGQRAGLDLETVLHSIAGGAAGCWTLDNLAPRVLKRDFAPGFYIDHFIKDMEIALDEAARLNLCLPGLALVNQLYRAVRAQGKGLCGTQALVLALEQLANIQQESP